MESAIVIVLLLPGLGFLFFVVTMLIAHHREVRNPNGDRDKSKRRDEKDR